MPPASLSTLAVMNPGPTTAKNSRIRVFQRLRNLMSTFRRHNLEQSNSQRRHRINVRRDSGQTKSACEEHSCISGDNWRVTRASAKKRLHASGERVPGRGVADRQADLLNKDQEGARPKRRPMNFARGPQI